MRRSRANIGIYGWAIFFHRAPARQRGVSLVVSLLMLVAVAAIGLSAAQIALQEEKASRNDRDRALAMQAAQAALADAAIDIRHSSRSDFLAQDKEEGFVAGCANGRVDLYLGLCRHSEPDANPAWLVADLANESADSPSVPYGHFTGRNFQGGAGQGVARLPRYIIERMSYANSEGGVDQNGVTTFYRITAIGFGMAESTRVVLQSYYRNTVSGSDETIVPAGQFGWREIPNWKELHDALAKK